MVRQRVGVGWLLGCGLLVSGCSFSFGSFGYVSCTASADCQTIFGPNSQCLGGFCTPVDGGAAAATSVAASTGGVGNGSTTATTSGGSTGGGAAAAGTGGNSSAVSAGAASTTTAASSTTAASTTGVSSTTAASTTAGSSTAGATGTAGTIGTAAGGTNGGITGSSTGTTGGGTTGGVADFCGEAGCQPIVLATGQSKPYGIAVDTNYVYWTNTGNPSTGTPAAVMRVQISGGSPVMLSGAQTPHGIVSDGQFVYWADAAGLILKMPCDGGAPVLLADGGEPYFLAVDANNVYWTDHANSLVTAVPVDGGATTLLASMGNGADGPYGIAVVPGSRLLWANFGSGTIEQLVLGSSLSPTVLAPGQNKPIKLTVDQYSSTPQAYWTNYGEGNPGDSSIGSTLPGGGSPSQFGPAGQGYWGVAADDYAVYWTQYSGGGVAAESFDGVFATLVPSTNELLDIAADGSAIYWVDATAGNIYRLPVR